MIDNSFYRVDTAVISQEKMQFNVTNRHPQYSQREEALVKAEIEERLFSVFIKYSGQDSSRSSASLQV